MDSLVELSAIPAALKPFDESGIWDPGMDPFPPSRAEAVRLARERGEGLGEKVRPRVPATSTSGWSPTKTA
ncbi:MAG: hypothetical protein A3J29_21945 [Acidobacteria bacterium RIFCSPLOWO2_12_FULL_67_14b]|nr:MAG: hypothetical protein A3J29_21945 [Acidobacteria bacterium RIFCSPLOWO2_12_FULL_67_14b]